MKRHMTLTRVVISMGACIAFACMCLFALSKQPHLLPLHEVRVTRTEADDTKVYPALIPAIKRLAPFLPQAGKNQNASAAFLFWFTKCDLGLIEENCTPSANKSNLDGLCHDVNQQQNEPLHVQSVPRGSESANRQDQDSGLGSLRLIAAGFETPKQFSGVVRDKLLLQTLHIDSVLYNKEAACTIRNLGKSRSEILTKLEQAAKNPKAFNLYPIEGSMVVKLIWQYAEDRSQSLSVPIPVVESGDLSFHTVNGKPISNLVPGVEIEPDGRFANPYDWVSDADNYKFAAAIQFREGHKSSGDDSCSEPTQMPVPKRPKIVYSSACFIAMAVNAKSTQDVINRKNDGTLIVAPSVGAATPNNLVLVGINAMAFSAQDYPDWLWSSYWWSKQMPRKPLFPGAAWRHFNGCAVSSRRLLNTPSSRENTCYNPYLEGFSPPNGAYSNCMTCHFAANFQVSTLPAQGGFPPRTNLRTCLASLDPKGRIPGSCTSPTSHGPSDANRGGVDTHFLWSLADIPQLASGGVPHR